MQDLKITLIQADVVWQKPDTNRSAFEEQIKSVTESTDLILLPEMFNTGFTMDAQSWYETMSGPTVEWMTRIASELSVAIGGSLIIEENGQFFNRFVLSEPNGVQTTYDKRHLFRMADEHLPFTSGMKNNVFELKGWKIKPQICYDLRFPVFSRNKWSDGNPEYDVLIYVANWPKARVSAWDTLLKARAIENLSYCVGLNRVGKDGEMIDYNGHSAVYSPKGDLLNNISDQPSVDTINLSNSELEDYRAKFPAYADADGFSIDIEI